VSKPVTVLDTCCLINFSAIGRPLETVLGSVPLALYVAGAVEREEISIRPRPDAARRDRQKVDLNPCFDAGVLHRSDVETDAERDLYVQIGLQTGIGDGEAMSLAIAASRGWAVASDDRPARRVAEKLGVAILGTPEIVKMWAGAASVAPEDLSNAIHRIEQLARYQPREDLPEADWWARVHDS
jgi:predicted nucleic acid-binding protein